jgi:hypothetical protein
MTTLADGTMVMAVGTVGDDGKIVNMHAHCSWPLLI